VRVRALREGTDDRKRSTIETSVERMKQIGAVDIGGSKVAVAVVRQDGVILSRRECPTEPERGFADALARIECMLRESMEEAGPLDGIGVGCPGPLNPFTGTILEVGTLPGWNGAELAKELESRFGVTVAVENDADAAALGEFHWGGARAAGSFLYITISTGIGGGIILDGKLYRGVRGAHPELGHQVIDATGPLCYCGANGCWESLASGTAMTAWMRTMLPEAAPMTASAICERARDGDELAVKAMLRQGYYLGLGLANLVTVFAPEMIALGGGVMKSGPLFLEEAKRVVATLCTQVPAKETSIQYAVLGVDAGLLGAAQSWLQRFGHETKNG
jgi:glucokinase